MLKLSWAEPIGIGSMIVGLNAKYIFILKNKRYFGPSHFPLISVISSCILDPRWPWPRILPSTSPVINIRESVTSVSCGNVYINLALRSRHYPQDQETENKHPQRYDCWGLCVSV